MKPHWYWIVTHYCPVCGNERKHRERVQGKKPAPADRYATYVDYDQCVERDNILQTSLGDSN